MTKYDERSYKILFVFIILSADDYDDYSSSSEEKNDEDFDLGDAFGDILEGAFGIFRHSVKHVTQAVHNMVSFFARNQFF